MKAGNANTRLQNEIASYPIHEGKATARSGDGGHRHPTAGIAHDFNNLLMAVSGSAELISTGLGPGSVSRSHIATIIQAVKRGATLTGRLMALGRKETLVPRSADDLQKVSSDPVSVQAARKLSSAGRRPPFQFVEQGRGILVVDDDKEVPGTVTDMLSSAGYTVVPFGTALHALDEVSGPRRIDLMVVDFAMPDMRGDRFATIARLQRSAPILFISGYAEPPSLQSEPFWLRKPFSVTSLISTIEEAMRVAA